MRKYIDANPFLQTFLANTLTKKNYSKLFTILQNYDTMELWFTMENYGTVDKTMILYWDFRNSIYEQKKNHGRLPNTKKLWFIMEKDMEIYQNNW